MPSDLTILFILLLIAAIGSRAVLHIIKRMEKKEVQNKRKRVLQKLAHEDIESKKTDVGGEIKYRLLKYYNKDEITPDLIAYFGDNYLKTLEQESKKLAEQKALEEKRESELEHDLNALGARQEAQLKAFKTVKELHATNPTTQE